MIAAILSDLWPVLTGGVVAIIALLTGWARHKQAQTTEAQAGQKVAESEKREAAKDAALARVMVLAICLQESGLIHRRQIDNGPARGFPQFELGTRKSRGGVWGVYLHDASRCWLDRLCASRGVQFLPESIWRAMETDDVLAAGVARLLLFTDPMRLPAIDDVDGAWGLYLRTWRPGKPRQVEWPGNHTLARLEVIK